MTEELGGRPSPFVDALRAFGADGQWESLPDEEREAAIGWLGSQPDQLPRRSRLVALRVRDGLALLPAELDRHWAAWEADRGRAVGIAERARRVVRGRNVHPLSVELDDHPEAQRTWMGLSAEERLALLSYVNQPTRSRARRSRAREVRQALTLGLDGAHRWLTFFSSPDAFALLERAVWAPIDPAGLPLPRARNQPAPPSLPPLEEWDALPRADGSGYRVQLERQADRPQRSRWVVFLLNAIFSVRPEPPDFLYRATVVTGRWDRVVYTSDWTYLYERAEGEVAALRQLVLDQPTDEVEDILRLRRLSGNEHD